MIEMSSVEINAALSHTIHLLTLVTRYLGLALPFVPTYSRPHVGRPSMRPNQPFTSTTKFREKNVLWMSSTRQTIKHRHFLTAFALLAHSVAYLAWSQGVRGVGMSGDEADSSASEGEASASTVLIRATSLLELICAVADSPKLGEQSHEPGELRHLGFGLDVTKVVSTVLAAEDAHWGDGDDWDLVEMHKG